MSELYPNDIHNNTVIVDNNTVIIDNKPIVNKTESPIITNIESNITNILNTIDQNNYTNEDKFELEKCIFNIQYKLKAQSIPTNIKLGLTKVNKMIHDIPDISLNKYIGDLYTLNNCLLTFNDKLNNKYLYKNVKKNTNHTDIIDTNNTDIIDTNYIQHKQHSIYLKSITYLFVISVIFYLFYYNDDLV
jgi:hypothetical protein